MARFLSQHTLACLTRQGAVQLSARFNRSESPSARKVMVNMLEGKMLVEFDATDRAELEKWFVAECFHFDWILRIEYEGEPGELHPV